MIDKKLYRSQDDKMLTGLAGGLGDYFGVDSTIIRILFVILEIMTAGLLIFGYLLVSLIIPKQPVNTTK